MIEQLKQHAPLLLLLGVIVFVLIALRRASAGSDVPVSYGSTSAGDASGGAALASQEEIARINANASTTGSILGFLLSSDQLVAERETTLAQIAANKDISIDRNAVIREAAALEAQTQQAASRSAAEVQAATLNAQLEAATTAARLQAETSQHNNEVQAAAARAQTSAASRSSFFNSLFNGLPTILGQVIDIFHGDDQSSSGGSRSSGGVSVGTGHGGITIGTGGIGYPSFNFGG